MICQKETREGEVEMGKTCQPFLLVLGLLFFAEGVKRPRWAVWEKRREFLRLELLLDAVKLAAAGRHCGPTNRGRCKNSALIFSPSGWSSGRNAPY